MNRYSEEVLQYIAAQSNKDPLKLMLATSPFEEVSSKEIAQQVMGRKVAQRKFPFLLKYPQYQYPTKTSLEQSSSELTAKYKASLVEGHSLVDLTGGMGLDTYFFSERIASVTHIELNELLSEQVKYNFSVLGKSITTRCTSAEAFLAETKEQLDWLYIDPSRRVSGNRKTSIQNLVPNVIDLQDVMLRKSKRCIIKLSPMQDITEALQSLKCVTSVRVIAVKDEVKELLIFTESNYTGDVRVGFTVLGYDTPITFTVSTNMIDDVSMGFVGEHLYQPHPAMVKAGLHNHCAKQLELKKLHPNTQLYTSDDYLENWTGRVFKIEQEIKLSKSESKKIFPEGKANIISKNHPLAPSDIAKKLKLKQGGKDYIIAYTDVENKKRAFKCVRQQ